MEKKDNTAKVLLGIMGVLLLGLSIVTLITFTQDMFSCGCVLVAVECTAAYAFLLYKKPHGNMLKYAMLVVALAILVDASVNLSKNPGLLGIYLTRILCGAGLAYCAGRLHKIAKNKYVLAVVDVALLVVAFIGIITQNGNIGWLAALRSLSDSTCVTTLIIAYFARFKEHKEAGIAEV